MHWACRDSCSRVREQLREQSWELRSETTQCSKKSRALIRRNPVAYFPNRRDLRASTIPVRMICTSRLVAEVLHRLQDQLTRGLPRQLQSKLPKNHGHLEQ